MVDLLFHWELESISNVLDSLLWTCSIQQMSCGKLANELRVHSVRINFASTYNLQKIYDKVSER